MKKIKNFIFVVICLFLFPMVTKAVLIGNFDYGGKVVIKWVDAHNKLNMRPDEITIPLKAEVWSGGKTKTVQYELTLNKKDAQITENGIYTYWTFNISFPSLKNSFENPAKLIYFPTFNPYFEIYFINIGFPIE